MAQRPEDDRMGPSSPVEEPMAPVASPVFRPCPACGRDWGAGMACQFCRQVEGLPEGTRLSSPGWRFGGFLLTGFLWVFTAGIGYMIWAAIIYTHGQTPAKQLLGMRVVSLPTLTPGRWGTMFLRGLIVKPAIGLLCCLAAGIPFFWLTWDSRNQELWDKIVNTVVVDDKDNQLLPRDDAAS
jgi:uncharacterized RDD family membrane protein YckC